MVLDDPAIWFSPGFWPSLWLEFDELPFQLKTSAGIRAPGAAIRSTKNSLQVAAQKLFSKFDKTNELKYIGNSCNRWTMHLDCVSLRNYYDVNKSQCPILSIPFFVHLYYVNSIILITSVITPFDKFAWNTNTISKNLQKEPHEL